MKKLYIFIVMNLCVLMLNAQNLVAQFKMDEGSGTTIVDNVSGITGELMDGVVWTSGKSGSALDFGSASETAVVIIEETEKTKVLNFTDGSFTVSCLAQNVNSADLGDQMFVLKGDNGTDGPNGNGNRFCIYSKNGTMRFSVDDNLIKTEIQVTLDESIYLADQWNEIVGVRDIATDQIFVYINGVMVGSKTDETGPIDIANQRMLIGNYHNLSNKMNGKMDDVRVYNYALSADEVKNIYSTASSSSSFKAKTDDVSIFPNPANNLLNIDIKAEKFSAEILDLNGRVVLKSNNSRTLNIQALNQGIYILKINDGESIATNRFQIAR